MTEQQLHTENVDVLHDEKAPDQDDEALGKDILARIEKGDKATDRAAQMHKSAGLLLIKAKERVKNFEAFLVQNCKGLQHSRAYELIAIAAGRTTTEEVREKTKARTRRHREKAAASSVSATERTQPVSSQHALTEFKYAVDHWMPKMDAETKQKARAYVAEKAQLN